MTQPTPQQPPTQPAAPAKQSTVAYTFTGNKDENGVPEEFHFGIPASDLTDEDVAALDQDLQDTLSQSPIYSSATKRPQQQTTSTAPAQPATPPKS
jgi:hypothetical protein